MATFDGKTDNFHTLTTYDSQYTIIECINIFKFWLDIGYKIDCGWIQRYDDGELSCNISVSVLESGEVVVEGELL